MQSIDTQTLSLAQKTVQATQQKIKAEVSALSDDVSFENSESFSLLINAFTVKVPYKLDDFSAIPFLYFAA